MPETAAEPTTTNNPNQPIASCTLDQASRAEQATRYRSLSTAVSRIQRSADTVVVEFDGQLDRDLLEHTLAVERQCCSFFAIEFENRERRLTISVRETDQTPALDVLASPFSKEYWRQHASEHGQP